MFLERDDSLPFTQNLFSYFLQNRFTCCVVGGALVWWCGLGGDAFER